MQEGFISPDHDQIISEIAGHYEAIIRLLGEDISREGLLKTPLRAAKAIYYATSGYRSDPDQVVNGALFEAPGSGMVIIRDIEFYSFCEHHILPFFGSVSVGYLPSDKMIGLSKAARLVDLFARRLQVQERLTVEICHELVRILNPRGVIVQCQAQHLCMKMRGVEKQDSSTVTVEYSGLFEQDAPLRQQFFDAIR